MPMFACRWPNGDASFVEAANKDDAFIRLDDEIGPAQPEWLTEIAFGEFVLHTTLTDTGDLALAPMNGPGDAFGEQLRTVVQEELYPLISAVYYEADEKGLDDEAVRMMMPDAVKRERERIPGVTIDDDSPTTVEPAKGVH